MPPIKDTKGLLITDPLEQSHLFSQYFASVLTTDDGKQPTSKVLPDCSISNVVFNPIKVFNTLRGLKSTTFRGPDGLPNILPIHVVFSVTGCLCVCMCLIDRIIN